MRPDRRTRFEEAGYASCLVSVVLAVLSDHLESTLLLGAALGLTVFALGIAIVLYRTSS